MKPPKRVIRTKGKLPTHADYSAQDHSPKPKVKNGIFARLESVIAASGYREWRMPEGVREIRILPDTQQERDTWVREYLTFPEPDPVIGRVIEAVHQQRPLFPNLTRGEVRVGREIWRQLRAESALDGRYDPAEVYGFPVRLSEGIEPNDIVLTDLSVPRIIGMDLASIEQRVLAFSNLGVATQQAAEAIARVGLAFPRSMRVRGFVHDSVILDTEDGLTGDELYSRYVSDNAQTDEELVPVPDPEDGQVAAKDKKTGEFKKRPHDRFLRENLRHNKRGGKRR